MESYFGQDQGAKMQDVRPDMHYQVHVCVCACVCAFACDTDMQHSSVRVQPEPG